LAEQERKDEFVDYESFSGHKNRSSKKMHWGFTTRLGHDSLLVYWYLPTIGH
jgi:hypothetical protein